MSVTHAYTEHQEENAKYVVRIAVSGQRCFVLHAHCFAIGNIKLEREPTLS